MKRIIKLLTLATLITGAFFMTQTSNAAETKDAVFAGGCFWCLEKSFDDTNGVSETIVGYAGGHLENPTYKDVSSGASGHFEVLKITYDPAIVTFEKLMDVYFSEIDPFDAEGQFCDRGEQYKPVIFYSNEEEKQAAQNAIEEKEKSFDQKFNIALSPLEIFYPAEEYHQDYYKKNATRYKIYRWNCGRDERLGEVWGEDKKSHAE